MMEYTPVDFATLEKVELIAFDDPDYAKWKTWIRGKNQLSESQIRRKQEIEKYPTEIEYIKNIWLHKQCRYCSKFYSGGRCYGGYDGYTPNTTNPFHDAQLCEYFKLGIHNIRTNTPHLNIHPSNVYHYLFDMGIVDKPEIKPIGVKAKQYENDFKRKVKEKNTELTIIEKCFKLYHLNGKTTFRIPDLLYQIDNDFSIVEYKAASYYGNFQQLLDYEQLFFISTDKKPTYLYWVIKSSSFIEELKNKNPRIQVFTEDGFLKHIGPQTGLSSWM